jgi:formylglycine-generating enzyme required for sulfatase activity
LYIPLSDLNLSHCLEETIVKLLVHTGPKKMTQVFISYSRKDLVFVERLAKDLQTAGLDVWYDLSGLAGGTRWGKEIQNAIKQSQVFVVVLSPNSVDSDWVEKEFMYANSLKCKIIPLLYQPCEPPLWFINLHFIDVQGTNYDRNFRVILKAMGVKPGDLKKVATPPVAVASTQAAPESQKLPVPPVGSEKSKTGPNGRRIMISPAWTIGLVVLAMIIAFLVWGMPALSARPVSSSSSSTTSTYTPAASLVFTPTIPPSLTPTFTLTPTATLGIGSACTRTVDDMAIAYVPEGNFNMGGYFYAEERPFHGEYLSSYWIDKTEVTNSMYAKCVHAGSCQLPDRLSSATRLNYFGNPQYDNFPVIYVNWNDAASYCKWAGARLPTEAEWEKAARGTDGRNYPWDPGAWNVGPTNDLLNYNSFIGDTTIVGKYPSGASPYGALDMAGNVWEWVNDWYDANYFATSPTINPQGPSSGTYRVQRGGAWFSYGQHIYVNFRYWRDPAFSDFGTGFRCAR